MGLAKGIIDDTHITLMLYLSDGTSLNKPKMRLNLLRRKILD